MSPWIRSLLLATAVSILLVGCGDADGGADDAGTQPAPGVSTFEQGQFENLPRPPEAEPVGPRSEQEGIVARSFRVEGMPPRDVLAYYEDALAERGWTPVGSIEEFKEGYRGDWTKDEWDLRVSAHDAPGLGDEGDGREMLLTQLSLVLSPTSATTIPGGEPD